MEIASHYDPGQMRCLRSSLRLPLEQPRSVRGALGATPQCRAGSFQSRCVEWRSPPRERGRVGEGASALPIRGDVIASDQRAVDDLQLIAVALRRKLW
jgi:hypothetical protein